MGPGKCRGLFLIEGFKGEIVKLKIYSSCPANRKTLVGGSLYFSLNLFQIKISFTSFSFVVGQAQRENFKGLLFL